MFGGKKCWRSIFWGSTLVKGDFASLYPASSIDICFTQSDGTVHKPLEEWYTGFPSPVVRPDGTGGWQHHDFGGVDMGPEQYEELKHMHGIIRIQYDQEEMTRDCNTFEQFPTQVGVGEERGFPFFLQSMKAGSFSTLAPIRLLCSQTGLF